MASLTDEFTLSDDPQGSLVEKLKKLEVTPNAEVKEKLELIQFLKNHKMRKPDLVVKYGLDLINSHQLGDDEWDMIEDVMISSLDIGDAQLAYDMYTTRLEKKFKKPEGSIRLDRLKARLHEFKGNYENATRIYNSILHRDQANKHAYRRLACIAKAKGDTSATVEALNKYLKIFPGDLEGWLELAEAYTSLERYEYVKFCYEEAILIEPHDYRYPLLYADALYSLGQQKRKGNVRNPIETAKTYYIQALELCPGNVRSLFGLAMCIRCLKVTPQMQELFEWTEMEITKAYSKAGKGGRNMLNYALKALRQ